VNAGSPSVCDALGLTISSGSAYPSCLCWTGFSSSAATTAARLFEVYHGHADIPAAQPQAQEQARVPRADGDEGRPKDPEQSASQGAQAPRRHDRQEVTG